MVLIKNQVKLLTQQYIFIKFQKIFRNILKKYVFTKLLSTSLVHHSFPENKKKFQIKKIFLENLKFINNGLNIF